MDPDRKRSSRTAEYMAFFRALETRESPDRRLFCDPQADLFLSGPLRVAAGAASLPGLRQLIRGIVDLLFPGARPAGVARTRLIDDALCAAIRDGTRQLVFLGAGFDSRALRLPDLARVRTFEVDHPQTHGRKQRCFAAAGIGAPAHVIRVETDLLAPGLLDDLVAAGLDLEVPTFFLCEGVTNYLTRAAVGELLDLVSRSRAGNRFLFTYVHADVLTDPAIFDGTERLARTLSKVDESWTFGLRPEALGAYLRKHGLEMVWDRGSEDYRAEYWGPRGRHLRGYAFYRAAMARVPVRTQAASTRTSREEGTHAEGQ